MQRLPQAPQRNFGCPADRIKSWRRLGLGHLGLWNVIRSSGFQLVEGLRVCSGIWGVTAADRLLQLLWRV